MSRLIPDAPPALGRFISYVHRLLPRGRSATILTGSALALWVWVPIMMSNLIGAVSQTEYLAWLSLDCAELVCLSVAALGVGMSAARGTALTCHARWAALGTGLLLLIDAVVDTASSLGTGDMSVAVAMAIFAELPLAAVAFAAATGAMPAVAPVTAPVALS